MLANLENSTVATGLEKVSFNSNSKEKQCQRTFKLSSNCSHFTSQKGNAQNPVSKASEDCELRISRCISWIQKRQRNQRENCQYLLDHRESKRIPGKKKKTFTSASLTMLKSLIVWITTNLWKILKETGVPNHFSCLLRSLLRKLYAGQEASVRTRHGTTDWFKIGKGVCQGCTFLPSLFNFYAEQIMQNARLDESQIEIKITRRNINSLGMHIIPLLWQKMKRN